MCVRVYLIELKTHARSENTKFLLFFFMFHMKQREQKRFSHPVNTHTHIYLHLRAEKKKIHRTRKRQSRLETNKRIMQKKTRKILPKDYFD
jgi:hypothetical protein